MQLLTQEIREAIPAIGARDGNKIPSKIHVTFFHPHSHWTWYAIEGEPVLDEVGREVDYQFFGFVDGDYPELGYFNLSEMQDCNVHGLGIERDRYFRGKLQCYNLAGEFEVKVLT